MSASCRRCQSVWSCRRSLLFRTAERRTGRLTGKPLAQADAYRMIQRRATASDVATRIGCHSWRAQGITAYLENGGPRPKARKLGSGTDQLENKEQEAGPAA